MSLSILLDTSIAYQTCPELHAERSPVGPASVPLTESVISGGPLMWSVNTDPGHYTLTHY